MALKFKFKTKEEIPAEHQPLYAERDGAWVLDVDGAVEKAKLDEFRTTNVALMKQLEDLKKRFDGIDPEQVRRLAEDKRKLEEEQALKNGEVEKLIASRLQAARADSDRQLSALTSERDALNARLADVQINQRLIEAATRRGLRGSAIPDVTARARAVFRLDNGEPRAFEADGKTVRVGRNGSSPMTLDEWVEGLVADAPHLFEGNSGGGASGGGSSGTAIIENPWKRETRNLTKQGEMLRKDPARARALAAAAGVKI
jgi:hypothetical protein